MNILTRARRKKAGIKPPSPFFNKEDPLMDNSTVVTVANTAGVTGNCNNNSAIQQADNNKRWIQCDNCKKWRLVKSIPSECTVNEWYCSMNQSPCHQSCDSIEESWQQPPKGLIYTYGGFVQGQLVWGKLQSYPPWPAIITADPFTDNTHIEETDDGCIYHVEFLGKPRSHSWLPEEMVESYRREVCSIGSIVSSKTAKIPVKLQQAMNEADNIQQLSNNDRLKICQYIGSKAVTKRKRKPNEEEPLSMPKKCLNNSQTPLVVAPPMELTTPISTATGLQILQMLGSLTFNKKGWACHKDIHIPISITNSNDTNCTKLRHPTNTASTKSSTRPVRSLKELLPSSRKSPLLGLPTRQSKGKSLRKPRRVVSVGRKIKERNTLPLLHSIEQYFKPNNDSTKEQPSVIKDHDHTEGGTGTNTSNTADQIVPNYSTSLDSYVDEVENDLVDIENLLAILTDNNESLSVSNSTRNSSNIRVQPDHSGVITTNSLVHNNDNILHSAVHSEANNDNILHSAVHSEANNDNILHSAVHSEANNDNILHSAVHSEANNDNILHSAVHSEANNDNILHSAVHSEANNDNILHSAVHSDANNDIECLLNQLQNMEDMMETT